MKLAKDKLVQLLRTQGDHETADRAESGLPDEIDTDRDADALTAVGLDQATLQGKLATGGLGGMVAP